MLTLTKEERHIYYINHKKAVEYFEFTGELPKDRKKYAYTIHHKDENLKYTDLQRYIEWRIEDLEVVNRSEHNAIHKSHLGHHHSEETKEKLRQINLGNNHTEEQKQKISEGLKGHTFTEESKKKISDAKKGKPFSEEHRKNLCLAQQKRWERYHDQQTVLSTTSA